MSSNMLNSAPTGPLVVNLVDCDSENNVDFSGSDQSASSNSTMMRLMKSKRTRDAVSSSNAPELHDRVNRSDGSAHKRGRCAHYQEPQVQQCKPIPLAYMEAFENVIVTEDVLPLFDLLEIPTTRTCNRCGESMQPTKKNSLHCSNLAVPILHIHQQETWSCGFRNLQMMLGTLLPRMPLHHPFFSRNIMQNPQFTPETRPIPSLLQLQTWLQESWQQGFDPRGAQHYSHKIVNKTAWIGAIEASTILVSQCVDAVVVQFILCRESRSLLPHFVWNYFSTKPTAPACSSTASDSNTIACRDFASRLLRQAALSLSQQTPAQNDHYLEATCSCTTPPLYLQWEGHSVTIVGIRKKTPRAATANVGVKNLSSSYDLILFDPAKKGCQLKNSLTRALEKATTSSRQIPLIVPVTKYANRDCQIMMASSSPLSEVQRNTILHHLGGTNVVTAAADVVKRCAATRKQKDLL